ncbi:hypothetical protein ACLKA6_013359 [Drosophila palustris]
MRTARRTKHGARLQIPNRFSGRTGIQYSGIYPQQSLGGRPIKQKSEPVVNTLQQQQQQLQQQQLQQQQLQQQQYLAQQQQQQQQQQQRQQQLQTVGNIPSYADQMQAAFLDYQRQRLEFEQQQQQLLHKLYTYYPDVSQSQSQSQSQSPSQSQPATFGSQRLSAGGLFGGNNGLQLQQRQTGPHQQQSQLTELQSQSQPATAAAAAAAAGRQPNFYSTLQHMGFLQQQQQDILREQQQTVAQQFATGQIAPNTSQSYGMAIPESSVLGSPSYQPSSAVSHVRFSSGNLSYNF